jgi:hypothetical protein
MATKYPSVVDSPSQDDDLILTTSTGKVGIGKTSPSGALYVNGAITSGNASYVTGGLTLSGNYRLYFSEDTGRPFLFVDS